MSTKNNNGLLFKIEYTDKCKQEFHDMINSFRKECGEAKLYLQINRRNRVNVIADFLEELTPLTIEHFITKSKIKYDRVEFMGYDKDGNPICKLYRPIALGSDTLPEDSSISNPMETAVEFISFGFRLLGVETTSRMSCSLKLSNIKEIKR